MKFSRIYLPLITAVILAATIIGFSGTNAAQGSVATSFADHGNAANTAGIFTADTGQDFKCFEQFMACTKNPEHSTQETVSLSAEQNTILKGSGHAYPEFVSGFLDAKSTIRTNIDALKLFYGITPETISNNIDVNSPSYDALHLVQLLDVMLDILDTKCSQLFYNLPNFNVDLSNVRPTEKFDGLFFHYLVNKILINPKLGDSKQAVMDILRDIVLQFEQMENICGLNLPIDRVTEFEFLTDSIIDDYSLSMNASPIKKATDDKKQDAKTNPLNSDRESMKVADDVDQKSDQKTGVTNNMDCDVNVQCEGCMDELACTHGVPKND